MLADHAPAARAQPLVPALAAMSGLQALVALALFAPGVLAPQLGLGAPSLSLYALAVFTVGMLTAVRGGVLADRFGSFGVAALAALALAAAMLCLSLSTGWVMLVLAGVLVGLAFGPETPASSALLNRLASPAQRPLVFSIRQTGNQSGAVIGSLVLPMIGIALWPQAGLLAVALLATAGVIGFMLLRGRYDRSGATVAALAPLSLRGSLRLLTGDGRLLRLAVASMPYSAMQMALNTYFVVYTVEAFSMTPAAAAGLLAIAQGAGLAGRVGFGLVVMAGLPASILVALLGAGMAMAATTIVLAGGALGAWGLAAVTALFGLSASGWNGVFVAEVARLAPPGRVGEATGAVLMASYLGLVVGPLVVGMTAALAGLQASFLVLAAGALAGAVVVGTTRR